MNKSLLLKVYEEIKPKIKERICEFEAIRERGEEREFLAELLFCLLTPQSRAQYCWDAACNIMLLPCGGKDETAVLKCLSQVRFKYTKAQRVSQTVLNLKEQGQTLPEILKEFTDSREARVWSVNRFKGLGWKEGSHFLRNTGIGLDLAIIDRHILRMMVQLGLLKDIPKTITAKRYLELEDLIRAFSGYTQIPVSHLDLLFWYVQTGTIFK